MLLAVISEIAKARNDRGRKARNTRVILPPRKILPRSLILLPEPPEKEVGKRAAGQK
jgi:hypothetical protein